MDTYQLLRSKARDRRDNLIRQARLEYSKTIKEIDQLLRSLGEPGTRGPRYKALKFKLCGDGDSLRGMTTTKAAETVLREFGPLTIVEIVLAIQGRGCRSHDDPRKVGKCVRSAFSYHRDRIRRDGDGRWEVVEQLPQD